ncbi:MAG: hypothetical protein ACOYD1_07780 [Candidatus Nanopelagicales bacterium]
MILEVAAGTIDLQVALGIIAGVVATITAAILNQDSWTDERKRLVAGIVSAVYGIVAAVASGAIVGIPVAWQDMLVSALIYIAGAIVVAQGLYAQFKPLLQDLMRKTTIAPRHAIDAENQDEGGV